MRIGNASGFYGDRESAVHEMLTGGDLDYLTGDYLAELTMMILAMDRLKDPARGYARSFLRQMEQCLGLAVDAGVRVVVNAGGLNPAGLAAALREQAQRLGIAATVAHVEGDDLLPRAEELGLTGPGGAAPLAANAYLGAWGIVAALGSGADVVVTGRVTDASVIVGPAAHHFGWRPEDLDTLAGAVAAGHVIECGTQATGGNFAGFTGLLAEGVDLARPGFPIAEVFADGSSVITKHPGTGGAVTVDTVTAQLLYEIGGARYAGPDVTARFDALALEQVGPDRVRISGTIGEPPPPTLKVGVNALGGYRNEVVFVLTGTDIEAKADLVQQQMAAAGFGSTSQPDHEAGGIGGHPATSVVPNIGGGRGGRGGLGVGGGGGGQAASVVPNRDGGDGGARGPAGAQRSREPGSGPEVQVRWTLARTDHPDAASEQEASALLRCVVRSSDPNAVGRRFSNAAIELALASYPGFHVTAPPSNGSPYGVFTAAYVDAAEVPHVAVLADGARVDVDPYDSTRTSVLEPVAEPPVPPVPDRVAAAATRRVPLGEVAYARSGDKGGSANIGVWIGSSADIGSPADIGATGGASGGGATGSTSGPGKIERTGNAGGSSHADDAFAWLVDTLTVDRLRVLLPETADLHVTRHVLPNLGAVNFVIEGILGQGVSSNARFDPQAKALGEWLRSRHVDVPEVLL